MSIRRPGPKLLAMALVLGVFLLVGVIGVRAYMGGREDEQIRQLAREGQEAHDALCVLKADYRERLKNSETFLRENPDGIPGIPVSVIEQSVRGLRLTLDALKNLDCEGER